MGQAIERERQAISEALLSLDIEGAVSEGGEEKGKVEIAKGAKGLSATDRKKAEKLNKMALHAQPVDLCLEVEKRTKMALRNYNKMIIRIAEHTRWIDAFNMSRDSQDEEHNQS